jgi:uncharacterized protein (DUF885 family)
MKIEHRTIGPIKRECIPSSGSGRCGSAARAGWFVAVTLLATATVSAQTRNIDQFFDAFTAEWMRGNPNAAVATRYFTGEEQDRLDRQLTPETIAYQRGRIALARKGLAELARFDRSKLTEAQRRSADLMQWQLKIIVDEEPYLDYSFPLQQMNGVNVNLVTALARLHPIGSEKDAENYLARLGQVSARMDEAVAEARRIGAEGIIPPRFILDATIKQMQNFTDPSPGQNPFVTALDQKMATIASIPAERRSELRAQAEKIVAEQVYPAWKRGIALLESQMPRSTDDAGLWRLKGGAAAYNYFLHRYTTTNLTADQIHDIGLKEVARIEREMDQAFRRLGRTEGTVQQRIDKLKEDMRYPNPASEASREQIMRDINQILSDAQSRSKLLFDITPKSPVIAQPTAAFQEANAAANYTAPAPDGSRPGVFQYPRRLNNMTKFGLRTVVYHETVPGHHFQIALRVENKNLPRFQQVGAFGGISAISEGWGLYAERLAAESNWYDNDLEGLLGQLEAALFRARRLVVDTGLHAKHWTRQQAIDYGIEASEVERYVVFPGQACSYMIGQLKIVELREKARKALGDKFSIREYHDVVLQAGTVPLELLERQVDEWIRSKGGKV